MISARLSASMEKSSRQASSWRHPFPFIPEMVRRNLRTFHPILHLARVGRAGSADPPGTQTAAPLQYRPDNDNRCREACGYRSGTYPDALGAHSELVKKVCQGSALHVQRAGRDCRRKANVPFCLLADQGEAAVFNFDNARIFTRTLAGLAAALTISQILRMQPEVTAAPSLRVSRRLRPEPFCTNLDPHLQRSIILLSLSHQYSLLANLR